MPLMKYSISLVSFSDVRGGAAKASLRLSNALRAAGLAHKLIVAEKKSANSPALGPGKLEFIIHFAKRLISYFLIKLMITENNTKHSLNLFSSAFVLKNIDDSALCHLHWINNDTVSISDLVRLNQRMPLVISLHDEWFYCGAEHYANLDNAKIRFIEGYSKKNTDVRGVDVNGLIWNKKLRNFGKLDRVVFITPSSWLRDRAKASYLLNNHDVRVIPNIIDTSVFHYTTNPDIYSLYGLAPSDFIIAFGAVGGDKNPLKGFDLLTEALHILSSQIGQKDNIKLLVFGGSNKGNTPICGFDAVQVGHVGAEKDLAAIYSMASITVVPSRVESFGQVAAESLSCQTPVVAFNYSGLKDVVVHKQTGYLADAFDTTDLAAGIQYFYQMDRSKLLEFGERARQYISQRFSKDIVVRKISELYNEILS